MNRLFIVKQGGLGEVESLVLKGNTLLVNAKRLYKNTQVENQSEETG